MQQHPDLQNLLQFLNQNPYNLPAKNVHQKIALQPQFLVTEDQFNFYSDQIKGLYQQIFVLSTDTEINKIKEIKLKSKLSFQIKQTSMPICNKILSPNQSVFRCYDCMTHEASVLCKNCFENANHKGHRYSQIASGGGNCDCGNPDAIKPQGFCVHHPGKAEPVLIDEAQQEHFLQVTLTLFEWVFRLYERQRSKSSDILGQIIAEFLSKINDRSLYYNTLTYMLFFSKRKYGANNQKKEEKIIDKIFQYGVKLINFAKKITDVFFSMFSLEIFKYQLTISFSEAYNRIKKFPSSKFKSLYIQLFANNDILQKMLEEKQLVLYPQNEDYDFVEYVENLMFLSTIKPQVASNFFILLNHKGPVRFPVMDQIQEKVEKKGEHIVSIINNHLNTENFYYIIMESIIKLLQNHPSSMIEILQHYSDLVMDKRYSYDRNKVIMPFHKILAIILLAIYRGKVENINAQEFQKFIQQKHSARQIFTKAFRMIMKCFKQFSKTLFETSYFDNYIPLYAKSGNTIVVFDLLMFSMSLEIFSQVQNQNKMNEILFKIFDFETQKNQSKPEEQIQQKEQNNDDSSESKTIEINDNDHFEDENDFESISSQSQWNQIVNLKTLKTNVQLMKIMIEACISERSQILVGNSIKIQDSTLKYRTQNLFVEVMNNFKQITPQNLKQINKNFIQTKSIQDDFIKKFLTFDKNKKKYVLNELKDEKYSDRKFPLYLCSTLKKFGGIFAQQIKDHMEELRKQVHLPKEKIQKLKFLFNQKFLNQLSNQFINSLIDYNTFENKEIKKIFMDFVQNMKILQILMRQPSSLAINDFFNRMTELSQKEQFEFLSENLQKKNAHQEKQQQKLSTKLKFEEMKKKKLQRMKQMQSVYDKAIDSQKIQEQQNESLCIICRQDKPGLCFLASFNYSNILQALNKVEGRSLVFNSCFHPIHIQCFIKASKQKIGYLPCPLCKTQSNIMLPFEKQIFNLSTVGDIYERIITLKTTFQEDYKGFDEKFEEFGILSIFRALCSIIGKNVIRNQPIIDSKDQRLANILYNMAQIMFKSSFDKNRIADQQKAIQKFLQCLKHQIKEQEFEQTNFYAFEYVTLKILYLCFEQKSDLCLQLLNESQVALINKEDMKKIWQMCDQIVSLPMLSKHESKLQIKQMSSIINLYYPPETVFDLIKIRDQPSMVCKNGHQMCICIICKQKGCYDCKQINKHLERVHCGEGVAFNLLTGGLIYMWEETIIHIPSLYCNQMGSEWRPSKSPQGFILDQQNYEQLKKQILNQSIMKFLSRKYPDALKKSLFYEMNVL